MIVVVIASVILILFVRDLLRGKPRPSPEKQLGDAIARYLESIKR